MRKRKISVFSILLTLLLAMGLLAGCGNNQAQQGAAADKPESGQTAEQGDTAKEEEEKPEEEPQPESDPEEEPLPESDPEEELAPVSLAGAWDNDQEELSMVFERDGSVTMGGPGEVLELIYEWDGENLTILLPEGGEVAVGIMDAEGDLLLEDFAGYFYRVGSAGYITGEPDDGASNYYLDLDETAWEVDDVIFQFYSDGVVIMDDDYIGSYTWDGQYGEIELDGETADIMFDGDDFWITGEDGSYYAFSYYGEADVSIRGDIGWDVLNGDYDNDEEDISIVFYSDGTFTISNLYEEVDGYYSLNSDGELYLANDEYEDEGTYDFSDDTFVLDDLDGYFYRVEEAWYTP